MQTPNPDEIVKAWHHRTQKDSPLKTAAFYFQAVRLLAEGRPVSVEQMAAAGHLSLEAVNDSFGQLQTCGAEFDAEGNLVGAVLSLNPTPHHLRINGRRLFVWCALDTLFLPAHLRQSAQVESTCPASGSKIRLTVTPEGIEALDPPGAVLSIVIPGVTPSCGIGAQSGPRGPVCSTMHFFSSREAASTWLIAHPGLVILSADEAYELARQVWIEPFHELVPFKEARL